MWADAIEETRRRFEPRRLAAAGRWGVRAPRWRDREDPLLRSYDHQERLWREGRVVWARFIMANRKLYEPGDEPLPGVALFGLAPDLDADPEPLARAVQACRALRSGPVPDDPAQREVARALRDEFDRMMMWTLPPDLVGRDGLHTVSVMVHREHVPGGVLCGLALFPLLVHPSTGANLVLPREYWDPRLVRVWQDAPLPPGVR